MRPLYLVLFLVPLFFPPALNAQSLYGRLKCEPASEVVGPVESIEVQVNPARLDHRKRKAFFFFDSQGHLVEKEMKGERWIFEYDSSDRVVESRRFFKGHLQEVRRNQYRGNQVMEAVYQPDGTTLIRSTFLKLDQQERPVEMTVRFPNYQEKIFETANYLEDQVEIVQHAVDGYQKVETYYAQDGCIDDVMRRSYNVHGQLLRELVKRNTGSGTLYLENIYQYDEVGNWVSQKTFRYKTRKRPLLQEVVRVIDYSGI